MTLAKCQYRCNQHDDCDGVYTIVTTSGILRCRGLNDVGDAVGVLSGAGAGSPSCYKRTLRLSTPTTTPTSTVTSTQTTTDTSTPTTSLTSTATTTVTTTPTTTAGCESYPVVTFVIDASTSIDNPELCGQLGNFIRMKLFAARVVETLNDAGRIAARRVRFAVVSFADDAGVAFGPAFGRPQNAAEMVSGIMELDYTGGKGTLTATNVHLGLQAARHSVLEPSSAADSATRGTNNIVVLMTDGTARDNRVVNDGNDGGGNSLFSNSNSTSSRAVAKLAAELDNHRNIYNDAEIWTLHTGTCPDANVLETLATTSHNILPLGAASQDALIARIFDSTISCTPTTTGTTSATSTATTSPTSTPTTTTTATTTATSTGTTTATTTQCLAPQADIVFLVDRSRSHDHFGVGGNGDGGGGGSNSSCNQFEHTNNVVDSIVANFQVEIASGAVRVAAAVFAANANIVHDFNGNAEDLSASLLSAETLPGPTLIQSAFDYVHTSLLTKDAGFRLYQVPLVFVIVTGETLEQPTGAIASALSKIDADADAAGGSVRRYVADIRQAFQLPAVDDLSLAASVLLLQESYAKEEAAAARLQKMTTEKAVVSARCASPQNLVSSAQLEANLQIVSAGLRDGVLSKCLTTTLSTTSTTTTTARGCNGVPDAAECSSLEVANCFDPVFGETVFATCLGLCPGSCEIAGSVCHGKKDPQDCPSVSDLCTNDVSGQALVLKCPVLCGSCPAETSTSSSTSATTTTSSTSSTIRTTLLTQTSTTETATTTTRCSKPKADVIFLVERASKASPCGADELAEQLLDIVDLLVDVDADGSASASNIGGGGGGGGGSDDGGGGGGVVVVGTVTYGGGRPSTAVAQSAASAALSAGLLSALDIDSDSKGQAGLIDTAFAAARQQFLEPHSGASDGLNEDAGNSSVITLRLAEDHVPLVFVVIAGGGAFESSPGAAANEIARIEALLPAGSTVARVVVNNGDIDHDDLAASGSGFVGSAQIADLLRRKAELEFAENKFFQSIAEPNNAVLQASCQESVGASAQFRAMLELAVDAEVPCIEPEVPAPASSTATATAQPRCTSDDDHQSCDALREAVCGSSNLNTQACSVLVLAQTLCRTQSIKDECPAMCGLC